MSKRGKDNAPLHPWRWFPEFWELGQRRLRQQARLMSLSLLVGVVAGIGAIAFFWACQVVGHHTMGLLAGYQPASPGGEAPLFHESIRHFVPWLLVPIAAVGGLLSGFIVYTWAPEAEGHGTDAAIKAYHHDAGRIRPRVPLIKLITSALTLGTGGSGGREGPIAQIGAGFGSFIGGLLHLRASERRVLMAAGMGAGIAAIFKSPLAGALFAAEVLYRSPDFESDVIIPAGLASVTAYCTFGLVFGWEQLFTIPASSLGLLTFNNAWHLIPYTALAVFMVILAMVYTRSFYGLTHLLHRLPVKPHFRPMIGATLTALLGVGLYYVMGKDQQVLSVMSFGYGILQNALTLSPSMAGSLSFAAILLAVAVGKILTTGLTIGSGGSGGIFGPSMVIGGCAGGAMGILIHHFWPAMAPHPASYAIIGMAGFFAAAAKTPFSTLVIVSEMTGGYGLLLPTLWVCTVAFLLSDEQSIYQSQVASPAMSPAHKGDYVRAVLAGLDVRQFMIPVESVPTLAPNDLLSTVLTRLADSDYQALPVANGKGRLLGVVSLEEVHPASRAPQLDAFVVACDLMRTEVNPLHPEDPLDRAAELFAENNLEALPVVSGADSCLVGMVRRSDIARTYLRHVQGAAAVIAGENRAADKGNATVASGIAEAEYP
jgi:CIC family chloride channel protein